MNKLIYMASPYAGTEAQMTERYERARDTAAKILGSGTVVFSPIVHCHPLAEVHEFPRTWDFWEKIDHTYISKCDELWVLTLPGWLESTGVNAEIAYALSVVNIPVRLVNESGTVYADYGWEGELG